MNEREEQIYFAMLAIKDICIECNIDLQPYIDIEDGTISIVVADNIDGYQYPLYPL